MGGGLVMRFTLRGGGEGGVGWVEVFLCRVFVSVVIRFWGLGATQPEFCLGLSSWAKVAGYRVGRTHKGSSPKPTSWDPDPSRATGVGRWMMSGP